MIQIAKSIKMYNEFNAFVREQFKTPEAFIPLHEPRFFGKEREYVMDAIDSTFVSSVGEYVNRFEEMMAEIAGTKYAVATVNGTSALHIAMILAGVQSGDEVITQPVSFVATCNAITYCNATPHFVDVDLETLGMSPRALEARLNEIAELREGVCINKETGNKISCIVPMHTFGFPCRIDEIVNIATKWNIPVVEDAAESLGSSFKDQHTGSFGLLGTFSFNGNKTVTCGGGGAIVTDNEELAKRAKYITTTAKRPHKWEYYHTETGYNYRMPNLNAAMACAQLEMLPTFLENKRELAIRYQNFFSELSAIEFLTESETSLSNYWLMAVQLKDRASRDQFLEKTNSESIMTRPIWELMNELEMFNNAPCGAIPNSRFLVDRVVNIPSSVRIK